MITFQRNTEGMDPINSFLFFISKYPARNFHMETCQAIPSILSCFWPAFHPKNTTKVNVLWLSSPPPNLPHFCNTSESVELVQRRFEIGSKGTKIFLRLFFTKMFDKACACYHQWVWTADKDEPTPVIHVIALLPQSFHAMPRYIPAIGLRLLSLC